MIDRSRSDLHGEAPSPPEEIPLVDLSAQHREVGAEIERSWGRLVAGSSFILGPEVGEFEEAFARYCGAKNCVGVGSGTDALELVLRAIGIGSGDQVVVPANTFIATAQAVLRAGASPVFVDVDKDHYLLDPARVRESLTPRTRAVVAVHLYGQVAPVEDIADVCAEKGISLIHDAAQAHGATRNGMELGRLPGTAAAFSFYPSKNLGAYGDAGCVVTDSDGVARRMRAIGSWGRGSTGDPSCVGFNSRLDGLQACVLRAKLPHLDAWNALRREAARRYASLLGSTEEVKLPSVLAGNEHVWHLYTVEVDDRDAVRSRMEARGVRTGVHYPLPLHLTSLFKDSERAAHGLPVAEQAAHRILSLPMYPHISYEIQERVADALIAAVSGR